MGLKNVLVLLDDTRNCTVRVEVATALARRHEARVAGVYVLPQSVLAGAAATRAQQHVPSEMLEGQRKSVAERAEYAAGLLRGAARRSGLASEPEVAQVTASGPAEALADYAKYGDLTVIGKPGSNEPGLGDHRLAQRVLVRSGCPLLVVPSSVQEPEAPKRVMIAWNGSREAARAVRDGLPLLTAADDVTVVTVNRSSGDRDDLGRVSEYLRAHGLAPRHDRVAGRDLKTGEAIVSRSADGFADLIVMGAFGRSRLREVVTGGTTRRVLENATVPLFMSH